MIVLVTKNDDGTFTIEVDGNKYNTKHNVEMSDDKFHELQSRFRSKPDFKDVIFDLNGIKQGSTVYPNIKKYYIFDLQAKVLLTKNRFTIEDIFENKDLLQVFYSKIKINDNFFDGGDDYDKILCAMRTAGRPWASKPASFPIKTVDFILKKYNINNNYYDYSCGWGDRMLGSIRNNVNYFGTDPNTILCERLNQLKNDYAKYTITQLPKVEINCQGSEIFIPRYYRSMGLAFSSPPYFNLEDYRIGNQSYKPGDSYEDWLNGFMRETMQNIYEYLIDDGYYALCIKNFDGLQLEQDSCKLAEDVGFKFIGTETCQIISRVVGDVTRQRKDVLQSNENIYIFKKDPDRKCQYHTISDDVDTVSKFAKNVLRAKKKKLF